ncbi:MAG: hypothetical protein M1820_009441 [Bogoriella megaspora]|nr:MAG: hypothetical protein M1820_009441 [Bogoriella megaspora]
MPSYVVTGANRGLGFALVTAIAADPSNTVIGLARDTNTASARLAADGVTRPNVTFLKADITDVAALKKAAEETGKLTGEKLDYLINNAALVSYVSGFKTLGDFDKEPEVLEKDLMDSFKINVVGVVHTVNAFIPLLKKGDVKKVINISTGMADLELVNEFHVAIASPYAISKAGLNLLTAKYNALYGPSEGILFLSISPGVVDTNESGEQLTPEQLEGVMGMMKQFQAYAPEWKGVITPQQSAEAVLKVTYEKSVEKDGGGFVSHHGNKRWL